MILRKHWSLQVEIKVWNSIFYHSKRMFVQVLDVWNFFLFSAFQIGFKKRSLLSTVNQNLLFKNNNAVLCIEQIASLLIFSFILNGMKTYGSNIFGDARLYTHYSCRQVPLQCSLAIHPCIHGRKGKRERIRSTKVTLYCITLNTLCICVWKTIDILWVGDCLEPQIFVCKQMLPHTLTFCHTKIQKAEIA